MKIRPIKKEDILFLNEMRVMPGVFENMTSLYSERIAQNEAFVQSLGPNIHMFVAEIVENGIEKVVGAASIHIHEKERERHAASVGIMVHREYQRKGIGKKLMQKLVDLSDNWIKLVRLELIVFTDNVAAVKLYESMGFVKEGVMKYAIVKNGSYHDAYLMARYNLN